MQQMSRNVFKRIDKMILLLVKKCKIEGSVLNKLSDK